MVSEKNERKDGRSMNFITQRPVSDVTQSRLAAFRFFIFIFLSVCALPLSAHLLQQPTLVPLEDMVIEHGKKESITTEVLTF